MSSTDINLHTNESVSEPLHMEIVGLELSNDSSANNYNCDTTTTASTTSPIITSSLLVKRKTRVGLNNTGFYLNLFSLLRYNSLFSNQILLFQSNPKVW